jgi:hypothetical protein
MVEQRIPGRAAFGRTLRGADVSGADDGNLHGMSAAIEKQHWLDKQPEARILQNMIARGNRRRESVLSNQHRLLGEATRHRTLP